MSIVKEFTDAWSSGAGRPPFEPYLRRVVESGDRGQLTALLSVQLENRLRAGDRPPVAAEYARIPEVAADPELVLKLLVQEHEECWCLGKGEAAEAFAGRNPDWPDLLPRLRAHRIEIACPACKRVASAPLDEATGAVPCPACGTAVRLYNPTVSVISTGVPAVSHTDGELPTVPGYVLQAVLGAGGEGTVYKARQRRLKREVALKLMHGARYAGDEDKRRFRAGARAAASLRHDNIAQVYEANEAEAGLYYTMEYIEGGCLADFVGCGRPPLAPRAAAELIETLARAVHLAHSCGIVHRDLKPGNVLLAAKSGRASAATAAAESGDSLADFSPKITDFGLAKLADGPLGPAVAGTPAYMAPEQRGKAGEVDRRADIYALGVMLAECLTGARPDPAREGREAEAPGLDAAPRDLAAIARKCLRLDPAGRYQSAADLADDLRRYLDFRPVTARPASRARRLGLWARRDLVRSIGLAFLLSALVAAGVLWHLADALATSNDQLTDRTTKLEISEGNLKEKNGLLDDALKTVSAERDNVKQEKKNVQDEKLKVEAANAENVRKVVRLNLAAADERTNEGNPVAALPFLADGLATLEKEEVADPQLESLLRARFGAIVALTPRPVSAWVQGAAVTHAEFSPDGGRVLTVCRDGTARIWDTVTGKQVGQAFGSREKPVTCAAFGRKGELVAAGGPSGGRGPEGPTGTVWVWDAKSGALVKKLEVLSPVLHLAFSADSRYLAAAGGVRFAQTRRGMGSPTTIPQAKGPPIVIPGAPETHQPMGYGLVWEITNEKGLKVEERNTLAARGWIEHVAFDPGGKYVAAASGDVDNYNQAQVWELGERGKRLEPLLTSGHVHRVAFSSDGSLVLTASGGTGPLLHGAQLWHPSGKEAGALMAHDRNVSVAAINPKASLVITGSDDWTARLWHVVKSRDGKVETFPASPPLLHQEAVTAASFSPDGTLALTASRDGVLRLWPAAPSAGAAAHTALPPLPHGSPVLAASFSPDGRHVLAACENGVVRVWALGPALAAAGQLNHDSPGRILGTSVTRVGFTPAGKLVSLSAVRAGLIVENVFASGGAPGTERATEPNKGMWVWDPATGKSLRPARANHSSSLGFLNPAGEEALTIVDEGKNSLQLGKWNLASGEFAQLKRLAANSFLWAGFLAGGRCVAVSAEPPTRKSVTVTDLATGRAIGSFDHAGRVRFAALSADGSCLVTVAEVRPTPGSPQKRVEVGTWVTVWEVKEKPRELNKLKATLPVEAILVGSRGRAVAVVSGETVRVWAAGAEGPVECRHGGAITHAEFSRDESLVVTAGADRAARVWRVRDGATVGRPVEHRGPVTYAGFSPDGRYLATAGADHAARVWAVKTGEAITPWLRHQDVVLHAAFSPDGRRLATAGRDRSARVWGVLAPEDRSPAALKSVAEALAGQIRGVQEAGLRTVPLHSDESWWQRQRTVYPDEVTPPRPR
jgi:WD40 repeat protein/serine/threonine protein kinase